MLYASSSIWLKHRWIVRTNSQLNCNLTYLILIIISDIWIQQNQEIIRLKSLLDSKNQMIYEQAAKLVSADNLCKDLYVENSELFVTVRDLEQKLVNYSQSFKTEYFPSHA